MRLIRYPSDDHRSRMMRGARNAFVLSVGLFLAFGRLVGWW
jgi:hypothetical protein